MLGIIAVVVVAVLLLKYTNVPVKIPVEDTNQSDLQVMEVLNEGDLAKAIYGCYSMANFGESNRKVSCYILNIKSDINWDNTDKIVNGFGIRSDVYEKPTIRPGDIYIIYYEPYKIRFKPVVV